MFIGQCVLSISAALASQSDNVLLIVLDDISNRFIGVYDEGTPHQQPPTPTLDALARVGVRFTNCYTNPVCSPTRAALLTGRHAFRTGIGKVIASPQDGALPPSEITLPEVLGPAGYGTALVGKWHLGRTVLPFMEPVVQGFDVFSGTKANVTDFFAYKNFLAYRWVSQSYANTRYSTSLITDHTAELVDQLPEPWFIMASYHAAHAPEHVPPRELFTGHWPETGFQMYLAMIEALDTEIGRLLGHVDLGNTTVIVIGDNGSKSDYLDQKGKGTLYEPGINVPLIVAGAAVSENAYGEAAHGLVNSTDIFQTVLDITGVPGGADDSMSFLPVLQNPARGHREVAFTERFEPNLSPSLTQFLRMARDVRYKLIRDMRSGREEMYDLATAHPDTDGPMLDLSNLTAEQQSAYDRLGQYIDAQPRPGL